MSLERHRFHFVGIGGIGMCGLAELLHNMGAIVTGSDLADNVFTARLKGMGVKVFQGHHAEQVEDADVLVYSSAIKDTNPELAAARAKQIPLIPRAEALAEIMRLKRGIAVAGTHGKTTTTSLVSSIFLHAKASPTIVIGGRFAQIQATAQLGSGPWLIAEADESDGSFAKLSPEIAIITNIDSDHLDYFKTLSNLQTAFREFGLRVPFYGKLIACGDDLLVRESFDHFPKRICYYGFGKNNDVILVGEKGHYELRTKDGKVLGDFELKVPGRHNALNATAALIAALEAGIDFETCRHGLLNFEGVDRRFHFKGTAKEITVYDDYGHHPTEVKAVMQAFKEKYPDQRLVVMFQPHRFSRTQNCWHEFTQCFTLADRVILTDIYAAGEPPIDGIHSQKLATEVKHKDCTYLPKTPDLSQKILAQLKPGDVFLTLGAGDGWKVGQQILDELKK